MSHPARRHQPRRRRPRPAGRSPASRPTPSRCRTRPPGSPTHPETPGPSQPDPAPAAPCPRHPARASHRRPPRGPLPAPCRSARPAPAAARMIRDPSTPAGHQPDRHPGRTAGPATPPAPRRSSGRGPARRDPRPARGPQEPVPKAWTTSVRQKYSSSKMIPYLTPKYQPKRNIPNRNTNVVNEVQGVQQCPMAEISDSGLGHIEVPLLILRPGRKPRDTSAHQPRRPAHSLHLHPRRRRDRNQDRVHRRPGTRPGYLIEVDAIAVTDR